jgi:transposase-like protein
VIFSATDAAEDTSDMCAQLLRPIYTAAQREKKELLLRKRLGRWQHRKTQQANSLCHDAKARSQPAAFLIISFICWGLAGLEN